MSIFINHKHHTGLYCEAVFDLVSLNCFILYFCTSVHSINSKNINTAILHQFKCWLTLVIFRNINLFVFQNFPMFWPPMSQKNSLKYISVLSTLQQVQCEICIFFQDDRHQPSIIIAPTATCLLCIAVKSLLWCSTPPTAQNKSFTLVPLHFPNFLLNTRLLF